MPENRLFSPMSKLYNSTQTMLLPIGARGPRSRNWIGKMKLHKPSQKRASLRVESRRCYTYTLVKITVSNDLENCTRTTFTESQLVQSEHFNFFTRLKLNNQAVIEIKGTNPNFHLVSLKKHDVSYLVISACLESSGVIWCSGRCGTYIVFERYLTT